MTDRESRLFVAEAARRAILELMCAETTEAEVARAATTLTNAIIDGYLKCRVYGVNPGKPS